MSLRDDIRVARGWEETWEYASGWNPSLQWHRVVEYYDTPASIKARREEHTAMLDKHLSDQEAADDLMAGVVLFPDAVRVRRADEYREAAE